MADTHGDAAEPDALATLLAERIAGHFADGRVEAAGPGGVPVAHLGVGGVRVPCPPPLSVRQVAADSVGAMVTVWVEGGAFGVPAQAVNLSGYASTPEAAIVEAGCLWACSFGGLLKSAFDAHPLDPDAEEREVVLDGRRFRLLVAGVDRFVEQGADGPAPVQEAAAAMRRVAGDWLSVAVLESGRLPLLATDRAVSLGTFLGVIAASEPGQDSSVSPEVKVHGGDWEPAHAALTRVVVRMPSGGALLRDHAILVPQEPFPGFVRESLQRTLVDLVGARATASEAAGWRGWRRHGGRLGAPLSQGELEELRAAAGGSLPRAYEHFVSTVAASGAGPGYGLERPAVVGEGDARSIVLAFAGCGVFWYLRLAGPGRGTVWVDARSVSEDEDVQVAASFQDWYAAWLESAVRAVEVFEPWDGRGCAGKKGLGQILQRAQSEHPDEELEGRLAELYGSARITLTSGGGPIPAGAVIDPCHSCVAVFDRFGYGDETFAVGAPTTGVPGSTSNPVAARGVARPAGRKSLRDWLAGR